MGNKQQNLNQNGKLNTRHSPVAFCFSLGGKDSDSSFSLTLTSNSSPAWFNLGGFLWPLLPLRPTPLPQHSTPRHFTALLPSGLRSWRISKLQSFPKSTPLPLCRHINPPKMGVPKSNRSTKHSRKITSSVITSVWETYHISFLEHHFSKLKVLRSSAVKIPA